MAELLQRQVDALGIKTNIHYAGTPGHQPILLLHGTSTSGDSFREVMQGLENNHYLIAPDIPGFGQSAETDPYSLDHLIEWLASLIDRLDFTSVDLVGHSFGGFLAAAYAIAYPEDVSKLLLMSPALLVGQSVPPIARRIGVPERAVRAGISLSRIMLERLIRIQFYQPERMEESVWERRRADYSRARASAAAVSAVASEDLTPYLSRLDKPTLVIWGEDDPVLSPSQAERLEKLLKDAQLQMLSECGHIPMIEQKEKVIELSKAFLG